MEKIKGRNYLHVFFSKGAIKVTLMFYIFLAMEQGIKSRKKLFAEFYNSDMDVIPHFSTLMGALGMNSVIILRKDSIHCCYHYCREFPAGAGLNIFYSLEADIRYPMRCIPLKAWKITRHI